MTREQTTSMRKVPTSLRHMDFTIFEDILLVLVGLLRIESCSLDRSESLEIERSPRVG